ncbi:MAG: hypothetical protein HC908_17850 [Calothrix sp. SM1_7_51]|nr:hypothetical protein [Calothrix sp. SM1_7_51]
MKRLRWRLRYAFVRDRLRQLLHRGLMRLLLLFTPDLCRFGQRSGWYFQQPQTR